MDHSSGLVFRRPQATLTADLWSIFAPPFSMLTASRERGGIGCREIDAQHPEDRGQEALGLTHRSVEEETERQGGVDGEIGILELPAPPADASRCPRGDRVGREPEGDVASPHEGSVVLGPVPDAIRCRVLRMHSRLHIEIMTRRRSRWSTCRPLLAHRAESAHQRLILRGRVVGFPLIATEGFEYYVGVIERLLGSACVSGHVRKARRNDRVVRVERRRRIGTAGRLKAALWESEDSETLHTSFVERLNLTIRQGSAYVRRRSPCHARGADQLHGHVDLVRGAYNFIRPHRALTCGRETRTPAMQAGWVNAPMNWSDIFTAPAALYAFHVAVVRVPVAVQLMHTSPAALSSFSWPHEHRSAA